MFARATALIAATLHADVDIAENRGLRVVSLDDGVLSTDIATASRVHGRLTVSRPGRGFSAVERELLETFAGVLALWIAANERPELAREEADCLALLSHDLRTPLTAVDLAMQSLAAATGSDDARARVAELVPLVRRNVARMNLVISDLLFLDGERELPPLDVREHSVIELLHEVYELTRDLTTPRGVSLLMCLPHGDLRVDCDRHRIMEVFANLLADALRSTPRGGLIEVDVKAREDGTEFLVRDTSPRSTELEDLFERKPPRPNADDTGLGLAISRAIVEAHGGSIGARTGATEGTTVHFTLPQRPRVSGHFVMHAKRTSSVGRRAE